jgi:hypothetical protein
MKDRIIGPFYFMEATVTGDVYLDMMEQFVYPKVVDLQPNIIYQQDRAPTLECLLENPSTIPSQII